ncbi:alternative ribosome rescue aminoacyl-tRNA hydrolase ArfB [Pedobacter heparinus]|uniref:Class I peptide chain release factor n=1 Tax=Pedobacter heparinus (strain ATCC 13125 / DSM 2366 / CIP 104194 / JCM 7457 / NBRC 12017 / NCIMB 9290 / NRRL B-14731 / HIM 762-3) TaxID=485917 RepID=C6XS64_PEDHD|nr:alternative ribosome rescue aminoacyl-tRNA hydrolase ArfB [Pedobacter heparinus]ACU03409.1 Class I peptide chain release factor [Pedobacter heparinus DSM 2366]
MIPVKEDILKAVTFKTSRSGGKGGQNVNKVSSKVELIFNIAEAPFFNEDEKALLSQRLAGRLDQEGNLHVVSQEDRSQLLNKEKTIAKLIVLLKSALHVQKKRKPTKIPRAVIRKRLADKQVVAEKKASRKRPAME